MEERPNARAARSVLIFLEKKIKNSYAIEQHRQATSALFYSSIVTKG
jgi:hypothetical protein